MTKHGLDACGGGGWTLVMKIDGSKVSKVQCSHKPSSVCLSLKFRLLLRSTKRVPVDLVSVGLITVSTMIYQSSEDHDIYADITFVKL